MGKQACSLVNGRGQCIGEGNVWTLHPYVGSRGGRKASVKGRSTWEHTCHAETAASDWASLACVIGPENKLNKGPSLGLNLGQK